VQVAGDFNRSGIKQYQRIRPRFSRLLSKYEPVVSRVRSPIGRRGVYAVRIGADARADANSICSKLQNAGAACVVTRNH
jgi:cell division septation protein DedD